MDYIIEWWRHQLETFPLYCEGNARVTGGFPSQRSVTRGFGVFFHLRMKKKTIEQTIETPAIWDAIALIMTSL